MTITLSTADPRSCKALALLEGADRWLKIRRKSDGVKFYVIPGSQGHVYWTNCRECSCPDFQHRGVECKHIVAVKLYVAKVQAERPAHRSRPSPTLSYSPARAATTTTGPNAERLKAHPDARRELAPGGAAHLQVLRASGAWS